MERVFLDANGLFSAAYKKTRLRTLWTFPDVTLLSSSYAVAEAETNLARERPEAVAELAKLLLQVTVVKTPDAPTLPANIKLEEKDSPILLAAISAKATHLLTGDLKHFGHLFGMSVEGVLILTPAQYLH
jgi:predicted nucleic acid-binding protein